MDGRGASNVVELAFSGEGAAVPAGLPEEAGREADPAGSAERREKAGSPLIARTRERIAAGFGRMTSAFAGSKPVASAPGENAEEGRLDGARTGAGTEDADGETAPPAAEGSGAASGAGKAGHSKSRMVLRASASVLALGVAAGLAAVFLPGHGDLRTGVAGTAQGPAGEGDKPGEHLMAPLASLALVKPRDALPEPVHVRPKDAGKEGLIEEVAAFGPGGPAKEGSSPQGAAADKAAPAPAAPAGASGETGEPVKAGGVTVTVLAPVKGAASPAAAGPQQAQASAPVAAPGVAQARQPAGTAVAVNEPGNAGPASGVAAPNELKGANNPASARVEASKPGGTETPAEAGKEPAANGGLGEEVTRLTGMITQLSATVTKVGRDLADLKVQQKNFVNSTGERLADFERRLGIAEAGQAVDGAKAAVMEVSLPPQAKASDAGTAGTVNNPDAALIPVRPLPLAGKREAAKLAAKESGSSAPAPAPASAAPLHYRVRAASPGLAMLAAVDQTGDESRPVQVGVGGQVPGYGRVMKIMQRGLAWVVETEKGEIR